MKNDFARTTEDLLKAAKEARIPEQVQAFVSQGVEQSRKVYDTATAAALDQARTAETVLTSVQSGAKSIGDQILANTTANTEAFFAAASQFAKATTFPEAAKLQAEFVKAQMTKAVAQSQELFALTTSVTKSTLENVQAATTKAMNDVRKAS